MAFPTHSSSPPDRYHAYLIRLWQAGSDGGWRALLQSVHTNEKVHFANLEGLFVFLQAQTSNEVETNVAADVAADENARFASELDGNAGDNENE